MDPITTITTAIISAVALGLSEVGKSAVIDAYAALKALIKKKYGEDSDVVSSIGRLEKQPTSDIRKQSLQEDLASVKADQDHEVLQAAKELLAKVSAQSGGKEHIERIQTAVGNYNIQVQGSGNQINQNKG